jgi:hypothetical protein
VAYPFHLSPLALGQRFEFQFLGHCLPPTPFYRYLQDEALSNPGKTFRKRAGLETRPYNLASHQDLCDLCVSAVPSFSGSLGEITSVPSVVKSLLPGATA